MATAINVELKDFGKELQKIPKEMEKDVIDSFYSAALKSQEELNKLTPVDTGALLAQWDIVKNPARTRAKRSYREHSKVCFNSYGNRS